MRVIITSAHVLKQMGPRHRRIGWNPNRLLDSGRAVIQTWPHSREPGWVPKMGTCFGPKIGAIWW